MKIVDFQDLRKSSIFVRFLIIRKIIDIMEYKNLTIIGTSHIARQSLEEVEAAITKKNPDIIALELDKNRFYSMMYKHKGKLNLYSIRIIGVKGFLFSLIGAWAEKKLGEMVGVAPGSEMKKAIELAKQNKKKIALIDQDIEITLKKFSKAITWKEKWYFIVDIIKAIIFRKKEIDFDLTKVPSKKIINKLIGKVKKRYPSIYKVLIEERNEVMARNLKKIMEDNQDKKILAIIGAGHEEDIIKLIKDSNISYSFSTG